MRFPLCSPARAFVDPGGRFFWLSVLLLAPFLVTACGTTAIEIPKYFWDLVYRANYNKQQAQTAASYLIRVYCVPSTTKFGDVPCETLRNEYDDAVSNWNAVYGTVQTIISSNQQLSAWQKDKDHPDSEVPADFAAAWGKAAEHAKKFMDDYNKTLAKYKEDHKGQPGAAVVGGPLDVILGLPWGFIGTLEQIQSTANQQERVGIAQQIGKMMWLTYDCIQDSKNCHSSGGGSGSGS